MKIRDLVAIPIAVTRSKPMIASGTSEPLAISRFGIVRIQTDEGIEGIGEISMNGGRTGAIQCVDVNQILRPALLGADPLQIRGLAAKMDSVLDGSEPAKAAVEMALFDIAGKVLNVPVYQLLGGRVRDAVGLGWAIGFGPPELGAEEALAYVGKGFRTIKLKIGRPGTAADQTMVSTVRRAVGDDVNIRVDANSGYSSPMQAIREITRLEQYTLQLVEQPLHRRHLAGLAFVRSRISTPLVVDESMRAWTDAYDVARAGAADALNIYVCEAGGLLAAAQAFAIGEAAGMTGLIGSQAELGIGTVAMAHLGVCVRNLAFESDITGHLRYPLDIINETLNYDNGSIRPPDAPGLGVSLNEDHLKMWRLDA